MDQTRGGWDPFKKSYTSGSWDAWPFSSVVIRINGTGGGRDGKQRASHCLSLFLTCVPLC